MAVQLSGNLNFRHSKNVQVKKKHAESEPADKLKTLRRHCKGKACICRFKPVRVPDAVEIQCDHSVQISGTEKVLSVSWLHAKRHSSIKS